MMLAELQTTLDAEILPGRELMDYVNVVGAWVHGMTHLVYYAILIEETLALPDTAEGMAYQLLQEMDMQYDSTAIRPRTQDLTGKTFERLTVVAFAGYRKNTPYWTCQCLCGKVKDYQLSNLISGATLSCGCLKLERTKVSNTTHGKRSLPEYYLWNMMIQRCHNANNQDFHRYGARGITVCEAWRQSFEAFFDSMGQRPTSQHTLERIDNLKGYEPGNVTWVTRAAQARNRRSNLMFTHDGITLCVHDWALKLGHKPSTVRQRIHNGWSIERALLTPSKSNIT